MTDQRFKNDRTASNTAGVTLRAGVEVTKYPARIRIDANDKLAFDMDEIAGALGFDPPPDDEPQLSG